MALYDVFDRPAFRDKFEAHTDLKGLMEAIDDTIAAINTGTKKRRDGIVYGSRIKGRAYFEDPQLREAFGTIVELLGHCKDAYRNAQSAGYFFDLSTIGRSGLAFHQAHQNEAISVAVVMDDLRNKALKIANEVYKRFGMAPFPYIQTPGRYKDLASKVDAVLKIVNVRPGAFGISVDLGKLVQRLFRKT